MQVRTVAFPGGLGVGGGTVGPNSNYYASALNILKSTHLGFNIIVLNPAVVAWR